MIVTCSPPRLPDGVGANHLAERDVAAVGVVEAVDDIEGEAISTSPRPYDVLGADLRRSTDHGLPVAAGTWLAP